MLAARGRAGREQIGERFERIGEHGGRREARVEHADALGLGGGQLVIGGCDPYEEGRVLELEPVGLLAAVAEPRAPERRVDPQQQRAVRLDAAGGEAVDRAHLLDAEAARGPLVGQRGVDVAVEQHEAAVVEQRQHALVHELRARGRVEQRLGAGRDLESRVLHERTDALGELDPAGLAQQLDVVAGGGDLLGQGARQRGLAGAVETLDRDQPAARHAGDGNDARGVAPRGASTMVAVEATELAEALPGIDAHPHARAVLGPALSERAGASHAYLFHGPSGTGKRAIARAFAAALLADEKHDARSVRERIERDARPDLTWVRRSGAAEMLVSDIEEPVVAAATRTPFEAARRVFVIEAVETMNDQAANRMLKTLEEPAEFVHLLLLTDRREDVLATIASRCQPVRFDPLPPQRIAQALSSTDPELAQACARLSLGDARLAERLASDRGGALRASAEGFARAVLSGRSGERPWLEMLEAARAAGVRSGEQEQERLASELELVPPKERKKFERERGEARRRGERRARTQALEETLRLAELWLRDVLCVCEGAPELIHAVDRRAALDEDATGRESGPVREAIELVQDTRLRLQVNVSEELALEALAYRLEERLSQPAAV